MNTTDNNTRKRTSNRMLFALLAMMTNTKRLPVLIHVLWATLVIQNGDLSVDARADTTSESLECHIWVAPSTLEGAGLGMFAGRDFQTDEPLAHDLVVPIVDLVLQNDHEKFTFLWDEYIWNAEAVLMDDECFYDCNGASPGFGATANSFLPLVNVEEGWPLQDSAGLHRSKDPGAGAFTEYHGRVSTATQKIKAGSEFFVDYGKHWFEGRDFLGPIPLYEDLKHATWLFKRYRSLQNSVALVRNDAESFMEELWETFVRQTDFTKSRVIGSFHHDHKDELQKLDELHGNVEDLRRQQSSRNIEWLREHGTCGDHIVPGPSTLRQAGRGAFATRDLPVGTILAQLPLIHLTERDRLDTYPLVLRDNKPPVPDKNGRKSSQLLLNYCYGHEESTLLLCPYGPVVNFVNHNQTLVNVKLQWGNATRGNHMPHLLESPIPDLEADKTAKLAFEMVVTRPIKKGEEVFMDYGAAWEQAWQEHLRKWEPLEAADSYKPAWEFRADMDTRLKTVFEQMKDPYPNNIQLQCLEQFFKPGWQQAWEISGNDMEVLYNIGRRDVDILRYRESDEGNLLYTVVDYETNELFEDLPRIAFYFVDVPHTTDIALDNAFRHEIRIPDDVFPSAWKNAKEDSATNS